MGVVRVLVGDHLGSIYVLSIFDLLPAASIQSSKIQNTYHKLLRFSNQYCSNCLGNRTCILLILTIFRLPNHVGNIATWTEDQWELKKVKKIDLKIPLLCNATKTGPITFQEKMSFSALTLLCKRLESKVFVIEDHAFLQQALELTEHMDCGDELNPEIGV